MQSLDILKETTQNSQKLTLHLFLAMVPILYPPEKKLENLWVSSVFKGYKMGILAQNGLRKDNGGSVQ